jgi:signal transduction histidine kinase/ActR/RegA family two-component response regulator
MELFMGNLGNSGNLTDRAWDMIATLCQAPGAYAVLSDDFSKIYEFSEELFTLLGYSVYDEDDDPYEWFSGLFYESAEQYEDFVKEITAKSKAVRSFQIKDRNGNDIYVKVSGGMVYPDEECSFAVLTFCDISDEMFSVKREIDDYNRKYRDLYENAMCGIFRYERVIGDYLIVDSNEMAATMYGEFDSRAYFFGKPRYLTEGIYPDDLDMVLTGLDNLEYIGDTFSFTHRIVPKESERTKWVTGIAAVILGEDGKNYIQSTFVDATVQTELEERRHDVERLRVKLKTATDTNRVKNRFIENLSLNIKAPVNSIVGTTAIAKSSPDRFEECAEKILSSSRFIIETLNNVTDLVMIEERRIKFESTRFRIVDFFENIKEQVKPFADRKNQTLTFIYDNILHAKVIGDSIRISPIFFNVLMNAVKYTDKGGKITLKVNEISNPAINSESASFSVLISDNGKGLSPEQLENIFTPFAGNGKSIDLYTDSTGLGLPIAKQIIDLIGGTIRFESFENLGTNVYVTFELETDGAELEFFRENIAPDGNNDSGYSFVGKNILIAEDNDINREILTELLEADGASVQTAENGAEAVERVEESPINFFDAILMDVNMPVLNGIEATKKIRSLFRPDARTVPIIALTANQFTDEIAQGMVNGMDAYEPKPVNIERLKGVLALISN